jgi:hypothetical protein
MRNLAATRYTGFGGIPNSERIARAFRTSCAPAQAWHELPHHTALGEFLQKLNRGKFLKEARRQSILASTSSNEDEEVWLGHADATGWK